MRWEVEREREGSRNRTLFNPAGKQWEEESAEDLEAGEPQATGGGRP